MVRGEGAEGLRPEAFVVGEGEEFRRRFGSDPGAAAQFVLQLSFGPAGVTHKGTDQGAGIPGVPDRVMGGEARGEAQALFLGPPEGRKRQVLPGHRTANVDRDAGEGGELWIAQEVPDAAPGRLVQDEAVGSIGRVVLGEKNHRMVEAAVPERRIRQQEAALKTGGGILGWQLSHDDNLAFWGGSVKGGW